MSEAAAAFARARDRAPWIGWLLAVALPLAIAIAIANVDSGLLFPGSLTILAVLLAALLGGTRAGLVCTGLSVIALWWGTLPPKGSFAVDDTRDLVGLVVMASCGAATSWVVRWLDRAEDDATATARLLDALLRNAPVGFAYFDRNLKYVLLNDALAEINGRPVEEHIGKEAGAIAPSVAAKTRGYVRRVFEEHEPILGIELRGDTPAAPGTMREWLVNYYPVFDTRRRVVGVGVTVVDVTERNANLALEQLARAEAERLTNQLEAVQYVTDVALTRLALDDLLSEVMARLKTILAVDAVRIQLVLPGDRLGGGGSIGLEAEVDEEIDTPIGVGVSGRIADSREPLVIDDLSQVEIASPVLAASGLRSLAGVPMLAERRLVGVLHVASLTRREFTKNDTDLLLLAAERVAAAIERTQVTERERTTARTLQASLIPRAMPHIDGLDVAAYYRAAGSENVVGGDFYDAVIGADDSYAIFIGDVSGKGIEAAALTSASRHTLRAAARHVDEPSTVLRWLDDALKEYPSDLYVTACFGRMRALPSGRFSWSFALGGHPRPILRRTDGTTSFVGTPGSLIGLLDDLEFTDCSIELEPGDTIVLYTDGVTDVPGPAGLSDDELLDLVRATSGFDAATTADHIDAFLTGRRDFEARADDTALVVVRLAT